MTDIHIAFLTHNRFAFTRKSLPALLDSDPDIDFQVFVFDNGSTDGTVEWLTGLNHPRLGDIVFCPENRGISPVTNEFWSRTDATFIGKIDNDIIVPPGWIGQVLARQENAKADRMGPITLYHWIQEWTADIDFSRAPIESTSNGSQFVRSSHTGGNYIFHRYLLEELGLVREDMGLKGGFTQWQWNAGKAIRCGYVYPLSYFHIIPLYDVWNRMQVDEQYCEKNFAWMAHERNEAKRLLELEF